MGVHGGFLIDPHPLERSSAKDGVERCPMPQKDFRDTYDFIGGIVENAEVFSTYFWTPRIWMLQ